MSATRRILVFGLPGIKQVRFDDDEMSFVDSSSADHLANYDIVIYCTGAFEYKYEKGSLRQIQLATIPAEAIRRENEIRSALEKGRIVCFVGSHDQDYVVSGTLRSYNIQSYFIHERDIFRKLGIRRSEFKSFIDNVGATRARALSDILSKTLSFFLHRFSIDFIF